MCACCRAPQERAKAVTMSVDRHDALDSCSSGKSALWHHGALSCRLVRVSLRSMSGSAVLVASMGMLRESCKLSSPPLWHGGARR